ncbi:unnamed protein product [Penicillium egyptiacum]|uniref:Uncharacterized protein n=1 Tax=Penicillium egyptiacum TaxID=1303716 RepID=A0A9W4KCG7_9EURO|nr:unnamed protein product [Penicillium egyptiacum]
MQYTTPVPVFVQTPHQPPPTFLPRPRPRFCILRPGGFWTPLIPLDELPSWLEICNWAPDMYMGMYPASMTFIPREGEYDVVCHHCSHGVDSLHQSVSEREASSVAASNAASAKDGPEHNTSPNAQHNDTVSLPTVLHHGSQNHFLEQPPFSAMLQTPFVGMCVVDVNSQYPDIAPYQAGPKRRMSLENSTPPHVFGAVGVGSPPLSVANSGNTRRTESPYPHAHGAGSFAKPQRVASLQNESVASMQSGSVASTRSLTVAAIEQLKRMRRRRLPRGSSLHASIGVAEAKSLSQVSGSKISKASKISKTSKTSKVSRVSKISSIRVISKHRRKVVLRRRRAEEKTANKSAQLEISMEEALKLKPEQPNSATKRRDRRERMMQRRRQSDRGKQPYRKMMRIPNWSPGMCKH